MGSNSAPPSTVVKMGQDPWSNGYGECSCSKGVCVQMPAPYTGRTFFTLICCKNVMFV